MSSLYDHDTLNDNDAIINFLSPECQKIICNHKFSDKIVIYVNEYTKDYCHDNPKSLFVCFDNVTNKKLMDECSNVFSIKFSRDKVCSDDYYTSNCEEIINSITKIIQVSKYYDEINLPVDDFGASLDPFYDSASRTLNFFDKLMCQCFGVNYSKIRLDGFELTLNHIDLSSI